MTTRREIRLPEDLYETLHFASLAFGGIGAYSDFEGRALHSGPVCIHGMARVCQHMGDTIFRGASHDLVNVYQLTRSRNDDAVAAINRRKDLDLRTRVTWEEWCTELNVVPVDSSPASEDQ